MANKTLPDLRTASLQLSNYETSGFVQTPELNARINEAVSAYYDLVLSSRETYFRDSFPFTLAGGPTGNTVSLPANLDKVQALDFSPGTSSVQPVPTLPSFRERHSVGRRSYDWTPGTLTIYPANSSSGAYELFYTPVCPVLADIISIVHVDGDDVVGSTNDWFFNNGTFTQDDIGQVITVTGTGLSGGNGTFTIVSSVGPQFIRTTGPTGNGALSSDTVATYQPGGTVNALTNTLQPGALWIELFTAIGILDKAEQDSSSLQNRLAMQTKRIQDTMRWKQDEPKQVPLVRRNRSNWNW